MHLGELKFKAKSSKDEQAVPDEDKASTRVGTLLGEWNLEKLNFALNNLVIK